MTNTQLTLPAPKRETIEVSRTLQTALNHQRIHLVTFRDWAQGLDYKSNPEGAIAHAQVKYEIDRKTAIGLFDLVGLSLGSNYKEGGQG